jgi:CHASE3 domain sensor protein
VTEPSLFDAIADLLPQEQREPFYRRMAHLREMTADDPMLQIIEAMGFLALITRETPGKITAEREAIERILSQSLEAIHNGQQTTFEFYRSVEQRLDQLPANITEGIDTDKIAAQIGESIRQQLTATGLADTASALKSTSATLGAALKSFSTTAHDFADPKGGAVSRIQAALKQLDTTLSNTMQHLNAQAASLRQETKSAAVLLCIGCAVAGLIVGLLIGATAASWLHR